MREKSGIFEQLRNKIFSKESEPPMVPGEIFDPEKELDEIKKLPHDERKQAVEEFKEKLAYQKDGLAEAQVQLIELIRKNPDASLEELNNKALEIGFRYGFTENQQQIIQFILERCIEKHQQVRELRKSYPDDKELFTAVFDHEPKGEVEVVEGPITLYFRLHDQDDFVLASMSHKKNGEVTEEEKNRAKKFKGFNLRTVIMQHGGEKILLNGVICAENAGGHEFDIDRQLIFRHEEQHAIERIIDDSKSINILGVLRAKDDEERQKKWRIFLQSHFWRFEAYAKDEILACWRGGHSNKEIYRRLSKQKENGGGYDWLTVHGAEEKNYISKFPDSFQPEALKILEEVYDRDNYNQTIKDGLNAYVRLVKYGGYSKEMAINLLSTEPLKKWPLVVKRMLENKNK